MIIRISRARRIVALTSRCKSPIGIRNQIRIDRVVCKHKWYMPREQDVLSAVGDPISTVYGQQGIWRGQKNRGATVSSLLCLFASWCPREPKNGLIAVLARSEWTFPENSREGLSLRLHLINRNCACDCCGRRLERVQIDPTGFAGFSFHGPRNLKTVNEDNKLRGFKQPLEAINPGSELTELALRLCHSSSR